VRLRNDGVSTEVVTQAGTIEKSVDAFRSSRARP
jgi:hypothetical protein